eukprot:2025833-Rhodomonas_salina.1
MSISYLLENGASRNVGATARRALPSMTSKQLLFIPRLKSHQITTCHSGQKVQLYRPQYPGTRVPRVEKWHKANWNAVLTEYRCRKCTWIPSRIPRSYAAPRYKTSKNAVVPGAKLQNGS